MRFVLLERNILWHVCSGAEFVYFCIGSQFLWCDPSQAHSTQSGRWALAWGVSASGDRPTFTQSNWNTGTVRQHQSSKLPRQYLNLWQTPSPNGHYAGECLVVSSSNMCILYALCTKFTLWYCTTQHYMSVASLNLLKQLEKIQDSVDIS